MQIKAQIPYHFGYCRTISQRKGPPTALVALTNQPETKVRFHISSLMVVNFM